MRLGPVLDKGVLRSLFVFTSYDVDRDRSSNFPFHNHRVDNDNTIYQSHSFFAECRAHGRIGEIQWRREAKTKGRQVLDNAVPCYGCQGLPLGIMKIYVAFVTTPLIGTGRTVNTKSLLKTENNFEQFWTSS